MMTRNGIQAQRYGPTLLRVIVGVVFFAHGAQKLFVYGLAGVAGSFEALGIPAPALAAAFATGVEVLGGAALILGLWTRYAAAALVFDMMGALVTVHIGAGFFLPDGYEFVLTLMGASAALALSGAGALALDNVLGRRGSGEVAVAIGEEEAKRAAA